MSVGGGGGGGKFLNIIKGGLHVFNFYFKGGCKYYYGFLNFQPAPPPVLIMNGPLACFYIKEQEEYK